MNRFRTTYTLVDSAHPQRRRTVQDRTCRTEDAIGAVERSVKEDSNESIRHCAQQLGLYSSTLRKKIEGII